MLVDKTPVQQARWRQLKDVETLSQLLRANAPHYWLWSQRRAAKVLGDFLKFAGVVVGDMHMGNLSAVIINGRVEMRVADFDDGGQAPLILDLTRHIITTRSVTSEVKRRDLTDAYRAGLAGARMDAPEFVKELLAASKEQVREWIDEYVKKNTKNDRIEVDSEEFRHFSTRTEIQRVRSEKIFEDVRKAIAPRELLDLVEAVRDSGGSRGVQRYRALVRDGGRNVILEFKHLVEPATAEYQNQLTARERLESLLETFWDNTHGSDTNYGLADIQGQTFWMRLKPLSLIDIPYSANSGKEIDFIRELSIYQANLLGHLHGKQSSGQELRETIDKNPDAFNEAVRLFTKEYQDLAENVFENR